MREIKYIAVHCTASSQKWTVKDLQAFFTNVKHWRKSGYHYVIAPNGEVTQMVSDNEVSNGVYGYNKVTINVAYIGGIDKNLQPIDNRTDEQKQALITLLKRLLEKYPKAQLKGHRDFPNVKKACPCYDVRKEYKGILRLD